MRLSGDHSGLARDEILSLLELFGVKYDIESSKGVYLAVRLKGRGSFALNDILSRAGLLLEAGVPYTPRGGGVGVEIWRVKGDVEAEEARRRIKEVKEELGRRGVELILKGKGRGDAALYLTRSESLLLRVIHRRGGDILMRSNTYRPFRKPVSMDPRLARASVNLLMMPPGKVFLDPFCGTGGIAIEAALLGYRTFIADADPVMVEGALLNFNSLSLRPDFYTVAEVKDLPRHLPEVASGMATDPPYGRSSRTFGSPVEDLLSSLDELVERGGRTLLVLHRREIVKRVESQFRVLKLYEERVHRSLVRYFLLFMVE